MRTHKLTLMAISFLGVTLVLRSSPPAYGEGEPKPTDMEKPFTLAAQKGYEWMAEKFFGPRNPTVYFQPICWWSRKWAEAELFNSRSDAERRAAAEAHLNRMCAIHQRALIHVAKGIEGLEYSAVAEFFLADAEVLAAQAKGGSPTKAAQEAATIRVGAARRKYEAAWKRLTETTPGDPLGAFLPALDWSHNWQEAEMATKDTKITRLAVAEAYLERSRQFEQLAKKKGAGDPNDEFIQTAAFYRADAETLVAEAKAEDGEPGRARAVQARLAAAQAVYEIYRKQGSYFLGIDLYKWSMHWRSAALALAATIGEEIAASEAHLKRMRELQKIAEEKYHWKDFSTANYTDFFLVEAEVLLMEAKAKGK